MLQRGSNEGILATAAQAAFTRVASRTGHSWIHRRPGKWRARSPPGSAKGADLGLNPAVDLSSVVGQTKMRCSIPVLHTPFDRTP